MITKANNSFKVDGPFYAALKDCQSAAQEMAAIGYDGIYTLEGCHDPFYPLLLASEHAPQLELYTSIAVSFPRNPLHLAYQALDLQTFSKGNFYLGLGSQIKPHIEKRFGVNFSPVVGRMAEQIQAIKAIFDCFQNGTPLKFEGEYYRHTLMPPMFNAGPCEYGLPPILTGGFGPKMCEMAGRVADGLIVHPFNNRAYLDQLVLPQVSQGLQQSQRALSDFQLFISAMVITGSNQQHFDNAYQGVRSLLAFYGSTPAYLPALKAIGYEDLQPELNRLSKQNKSAEMDALIPDELIRQFAVVGEPDDIADKLLQKYGDVASRVSIYAPYYAENSVWQGIIADIKQRQNR